MSAHRPAPMMVARDTAINAAHARRPAVIAILRSGVLAQDLCRRGGRADVVAVFARSFYLRGGETFLCVGAPAIGNGPLTLIADMSVPGLAQRGLRPGQPALVSDQTIEIGTGVRLTLERCEPWRPPAWPLPPPPGRLIETGLALARRAVIEAPREGLARLVLGGPGGQAGLLRLAGPRVAGFESWLSAAASPAPIEGLIGLGPGLTPSGDDFLAGALALLDALAERERHAVLAAAIRHAPRAATSPLSRCLLDAAATGHIGEHLRSAVSFVVSGHLDAAIAAVRTIGHSSGWDMMAGIATTLRIVAAARLTSIPAAPGSHCGAPIPTRVRR